MQILVVYSVSQATNVRNYSAGRSDEVGAMSSDEPTDETATSDETFHPLGEAWQDDLEDVLDDTEYDTELGMEMGRDAMRVTKGELSEEEFHERYHDDVMEEFGEDGRPIASPDDVDDGETGSLLSSLTGDESRREVLKKGLPVQGSPLSGGVRSTSKSRRNRPSKIRGSTS